MHTLHKKMFLPLPQNDVFAFFSDVANLERITPPELGFEILTPAPLVMKVGALIDYRLRLFGMPFRWQTRIAAWNPPHDFIDEQLRGPYREWVHTHRFEPQERGTLLTDEVRYRLPLWPLGEVAYPVIRRQLDRIFAFRQQTIRGLLVDEGV